eukprot:1141639-Pelagomonas_calceolata.AAC.5
MHVHKGLVPPVNTPPLSPLDTGLSEDASCAFELFPFLTGACVQILHSPTTKGHAIHGQGCCTLPTIGKRTGQDSACKRRLTLRT